MSVRHLVRSLGLAVLFFAAGSLWGERAVAQQSCWDCDLGGDLCWHCVNTGGIGPEGYSDCFASCDYCDLWAQCYWT